MKTWHIITGEYPPQIGGVSDYTRQVARGLAERGERVNIWAPKIEIRETEPIAGVEVHRTPGHFGTRALSTIARALGSVPDDSVLVQYVPHAFGMRAMNLPLCLWLNSLRGRDMTVMFHEIAYPLRRNQQLRHNVLGVVTLLMARLVGRAASRIMVAGANWRWSLRKLGIGAPIIWAPVPSNIPVWGDLAVAKNFRRQYIANGNLLVGHFGSHPANVVDLLSAVVPEALNAVSDMSFVMVGVNGLQARQRVLEGHSGLSGRLHATGSLNHKELSSAIAACDVMFQPYPDGVSTRRTSAMAGLAHGRAIITNEGSATESLWRESRAVVLAPDGGTCSMKKSIIDLVTRPSAREQYGHAAVELYERRFALRHTLDLLTAR